MDKERLVERTLADVAFSWRGRLDGLQRLGHSLNYEITRQLQAAESEVVPALLKTVKEIIGFDGSDGVVVEIHPKLGILPRDLQRSEQRTGYFRVLEGGTGEITVSYNKDASERMVLSPKEITPKYLEVARTIGELAYSYRSNPAGFERVVDKGDEDPAHVRPDCVKLFQKPIKR